MSDKLDAKVKTLEENINAANNKIEDKIDSIEKGLSDQSDEMTLLLKKM